MCMSEWVIKNRIGVSPEALYAGRLLERYGFIFGVDFDVTTAIDKATKVLTEHADEQERLLMEGKQIADKIKVDEEPRIQDRRTSSTFRRNRQNGWDIWLWTISTR